MAAFLKKILGLHRRGGDDPRRDVEETTTAGDSAMPVEHRGHILLTRRVADPGEYPPGFHEMYSCSTCRELFVLAWFPKGEDFMPGAQMVLRNMLPHGVVDLDSLNVFCPRCREQFATHGPVPWPEETPPEMMLKEQFVVAYPPGTRGPFASPGSFTHLGSPIEKIVVVVAGTFPKGLERASFICSFVESRLGKAALSAAAQSPIAIDVLRVDYLSTEPDLLTTLLKESLYSEEEWGVDDSGIRLFIGYAPVPLEPPLTGIMLCLLEPRWIASGSPATGDAGCAGSP